MLGESVLGFVGTEALKTGAGVAVEHYGPPLLKRMDRMIKDWRRASHPSLGTVREICDHLERFLLSPSANREIMKTNLGRYAFPASSSQTAPFRRLDMTGAQVANLWFRTETDRWKKSISSATEKWVSLMSDRPQPYFSGRHNIDIDYSVGGFRGRRRHPIFRSVHPFIMTSPVDRKKLGADPVGDMLELFLGGWQVFSDAEYTVFRGGTVLRIGEQAYADGVFTVTKAAAFGSSPIHEEVHLWRCVLVTGYAHSIESMNIGVPVWSGGGKQYIETHVHDWMSGFRLLRDEKEAVP